MAGRLKCNSCGATYADTRDGSVPSYFHVCPDQIVDTPEVTDKDGNILTPVKHKATPNPRNENQKRNPQNPNEFVLISEGSGVTEI